MFVAVVSDSTELSKQVPATKPAATQPGFVPGWMWNEPAEAVSGLPPTVVVALPGA
ncbi:hypothetical protein D3C78_1855980 [compost metagenome]